MWVASSGSSRSSEAVRVDALGPREPRSLRRGLLLCLPFLPLGQPTGRDQLNDALALRRAGCAADAAQVHRARTGDI